MVQAFIGLFSLHQKEGRDGEMGFKWNLLTSAAACMWASALLAVFMGYNVRCRAPFPSRDLVVGSLRRGGHRESLSSRTAASCDLSG